MIHGGIPSFLLPYLPDAVAVDFSHPIESVMPQTSKSEDSKPSKFLIKAKPDAHSLIDEYDEDDPREYIIYKDVLQSLTLKAFIEQRNSLYATMIFAILNPPVLSEEEKKAEADSRWTLLAEKLREEVLTFLSQSPAAAPEYENKEEEKVAKGQDLDFADGRFELKIRSKDGKVRRGFASRVLQRQMKKKARESQILALAKEEEANEFQFDFTEDLLPAKATNRRDELADANAISNEAPIVEVNPTNILSLSGMNIFKPPTPILTTKRPTQRQLMPRDLRLQKEKLYRKLQLNEEKAKEDSFSINLFESDEIADDISSNLDSISPFRPTPVDHDDNSVSHPARAVDKESAFQALNDEQKLLNLDTQLKRLRNLRPAPNNRIHKSYQRAISVMEEKQRELQQKKIEEDFDFTDLVDSAVQFAPSLPVDDTIRNNRSEHHRPDSAGSNATLNIHHQTNTVTINNNNNNNNIVNINNSANAESSRTIRVNSRALRLMRERQAAQEQRRAAALQQSQDMEDNTGDDFFNDFLSS